ncbi:MAG: hypothetical protein ACNA71_05410 [Kiritimatiellia bacterium]
MLKMLPLSLILMCLSVTAVFGQGRIPVAARQPGDVPPEEMLRVRSFTGVGPRSIVKTPVYNTTAERGARSPQDWQHIVLQYDVMVPWIDEMTVQFFVLGMIRDPETGGNLYSLFRKNIRYVDLEGGRDRSRRAEAFLRPAGLRRFGRVVATAAIVTINGQVVATPEDSDRSAGLPESWWENPLVINSPALTVREGYLLDRNETPWAVINYDDAEFIR